MMTLDEAITHAEWCADNSCGECADDHRQLAEWLRELRRARTEIDLLKTLRDGFKADVKKLKDENAKLRSERDHWRVEQVHAYGNWEDVHKYAAKLKAENDELRYKVHVLEGGNKSLKILYDSVKANNAELRELCADMLAQLLNAYDPKELTEFFDRLHGVGIEVNG